MAFPNFGMAAQANGPLAEAGFRVVTPDQRGYNLTDKTPPYDVVTTAHDIDHLIQACGMNKPLWWATTGARSLLDTGGQYPQRVQRLALSTFPILRQSSKLF